MQLDGRQRKILIFLLGICLKSGVGGKEFISYFGTETASKYECSRSGGCLLGAADWEVPKGRASPSHLQARFHWWCQDLGAQPADAELQSRFWCIEAARQLQVSLVSLQ